MQITLGKNATQGAQSLQQIEASMTNQIRAVFDAMIRSQHCQKCNIAFITTGRADVTLNGTGVPIYMQWWCGVDM